LASFQSTLGPAFPSIALAKNLKYHEPMRFSAAIALALAGAAPLAALAPAPQDRPTFKAGVDRVTVTAVVQTESGQPVTGLTREDFVILDNGRPQPILEFRSEPTPATVALLADFSGSMKLAGKIPVVREAAADLLAGLAPGVDRVGLFAFDTRLHELQPIETLSEDILQHLERLRPFGSTSLYDAVSETGKVLAADGSTRRAIVVLTDGGENSSRLSVAQVARAASGIDVPVYIVVVLTQLDRPGLGRGEAREIASELASGRLGNLAHWTGGDIYLAWSAIESAEVAGRIVDELRHQYFIGFAPDTSRPGWHPIEVRTQREDLIVRARSGYVAEDRPNSIR
jgi:Ca-activated chloride channel family protein